LSHQPKWRAQTVARAGLACAASRIRALMAFTFTLIADFQALWDAKREAMSREVDEVLAGLKSVGR
jgi:hypothetical protein